MRSETFIKSHCFSDEPLIAIEYSMMTWKKFVAEVQWVEPSFPLKNLMRMKSPASLVVKGCLLQGVTLKENDQLWRQSYPALSISFLSLKL